VGAGSGAYHTFVGNITQVTSGGAVYINTTGNILSTGASVFGNARLGLAGQVSGQFHTVVGNITQTSSGGAVYINTTGNVLATVGNFGNGNVAGFAIGYRDMPQNATGTTTLALADAGKHIYITAASQTITIPAASSIPFPIGTTIAFIAGPSATTVSIAITSDTMYLGGTGTTGTRTLAAYGMATAVKVSGLSSSGVWFINGSGLT
jgi:hypothetical protein